MTITLESATQLDIEELDKLYTTTIDYLNQHTNHPGWQKDVYPVRETAVTGINEKSLYVVRQENQIVGSIILNHKAEPAYQQAKWSIDADDKEVMVVHTFIVHPNFSKQGIGEKILLAACKLALEKQMKAVRLDVFRGNAPAIRLYEKCGFSYVDTVDLGLSDYGLDYFKLYEKNFLSL
ncbi:GNAT family N-acetyltransferase [uncultured Enterococcus sp.]|uniref:GNAT family N-acetyltransferase n=1 Tax=uncultured Enterococcus sp. TaxID=167972 RepID=UPI002AA7552C|nr:GNAT family N-acetyltransferase [uncultured Enterococcus sp.]